MNHYVTVLVAITAVCYISSAGSEQTTKHESGHLAVPGPQLSLRLPGSYTELDTSFGEASRVMHFEANRGQTDALVKFLVRGAHSQVFLTETEAVMVLENSTGQSACCSPQALDSYSAWRSTHEVDCSGVATGSRNSRADVLRMRLVGANPKALMQGEEILPGQVHYFIGNDPTRWQTNVSTFARVRYREVYPGIDLVYYGSQGYLEYDFVLDPGADPGLITLDFEGVDQIKVDPQGDLVLCRADRQVRWRKPVVYQEIAGARQDIATSYRICGSALNQRPVPSCHIGFELAKYDHSRPLVIDPILDYSTYLGGSAGDNTSGVAVDGAGNIYVAGTTSSLNFPTNFALYPKISGRGPDGFISKFDSAGALIFSTYLGGSDEELYLMPAVDSTGSCYVAGYTLSTNFPVQDALQSTNAGRRDLFVTGLKNDGALLFSTYLGGNDDEGFDHPSIALDRQSNIYVGGTTLSTNFPTVNALQPQISPPSPVLGTQRRDGFLAKIESGGARLLYSTYYGQEAGHDYINDLAVDDEGNAFILVSPCYDAEIPFGCDGMKLAKIASDGSRVLFESAFGESGGSGIVAAHRLALAPNGRAVVVGNVKYTSLPALNSPVELDNYGEGFVAQLDTTDGSFISAAYLGGSQYEGADAVAIDQTGDILVAGSTWSPDFTLVDPLQSSITAGEVFVSVLNPADLSVKFSTFLGGSGGEGAAGIAIDPHGDIVIAGPTTSANFPIARPFQSHLGGASDAFLARIRLGELLTVSRQGQNLILSWPVAETNYIVETAATLPSVSWDAVTNAPSITPPNRSLQLPLTGSPKFFRLHKL